MNQTIKSSILLIVLLGFSFFAFNFLNDSIIPQSETPTIVTSTTIQQKIEIDEFNTLDISLKEFIDNELLSISDDCIKFGSWFSLTENCLEEWLFVLNNIDEQSSIFTTHYTYAKDYFMSNYQNLEEKDIENILESLSIETDLAVWNEKLIEVTSVLNIKKSQEEETTAIFLTDTVINNSKNLGTSELESGCIDSTLINEDSEDEWVLLDNVNSRDEEKLNYAVKIEPSLGLNPLCIKNLLFLILNNDTGWTNITEKQFQLTSVEESDYVYIFASPEKTDEICAPIETNSIYSCRKEQNIVLNFFRWKNGAVDFKNDMETYRIYLINHETGHILGWGHVGCPKEGAIAPVMMQQSKGTEGCIPYGWPAYETIKSKFNR
ncbi:MAG: DUF3152 domain-containing protein [Actinomycetota bacterium]|nr:DUF3152 domain-containing protein [Actinomycetota bacterium]MDA3008489.1 DUF3152 domain-containing protein [Actinomycetota bacterium]MDA3037010.1 DUF3152 domain-containing protein [Actinomycetota bacterium]